MTHVDVCENSQENSAMQGQFYFQENSQENAAMQGQFYFQEIKSFNHPPYFFQCLKISTATDVNYHASCMVVLFLFLFLFLTNSYAQ
jgi:predicted Zn-dependent peptidase